MKAYFKILLAPLIFASNMTVGQQECHIHTLINKDTIEMSEGIEITFKVDGLRGTLQSPKFQDFDVVIGPNISSSMRVMNGKVDQKLTHSYLLKPRRTGKLEIPKAKFISDEVTCHSEPVFIEVRGKDGVVVEENTRPNDSLDRNDIGQDLFHQDSIKAIQNKLKALKKKKI